HPTSTLFPYTTLFRSFPHEPGLLDADVEVVPRQPLTDVTRARRVEARIAVPLAQRSTPVAFEARRDLEEIPDPAIAARQQCLERDRKSTRLNSVTIRS